MKPQTEIKQRKIEKTQYYWKCPKCNLELKGNGKKTLEHFKKMHEKVYCKK